MVTISSADKALKTLYLDVVAEQLNTEINPFLARIKQTSSDVWGKEVRKLAQYGVNGGIGAGKSVVSRILDAMGYPVYDCDSRAKAIMDKDPRIHEQLCRQIHPLVVIGGVIDRRLLAEIVFNDPLAVGRLNTIVHAAVEADVSRWVQQQGSPFYFRRIRHIISM